MDPGRLSYEYAKFAVSMNGSNIHVGHRTQTLPIFVRMTDKEPTWAGLKTLIPTVLTYGIMGYPYILPSVVGGHRGGVSKELYIRWMQVNAFLPGIQFEVDKAPWSFDEETKTIVKNLLGLRAILSPVILDAFRNVTITGAPIIRPLWWVAPMDPIALTIDSQFMLGDTYLVAPVLESHKLAMSVYLPVGHWQEQFGKGGKINNKKAGISQTYDVKLTTVLYFKCLALYN
jgi:alpha-glucosidase (family GH31 glycosyl hydrolase)